MMFTDLSAQDLDCLALDRGFLPAVLEHHFPGILLTGSADDIAVMQRVLDGGPYTDQPADELVALGTAFGDVLAKELGLHWVRFEDEEGMDLALRLGETTVTVFPRSMILKRIERGDERLALSVMFQGVRAEVERLKSECV